MDIRMQRTDPFEEMAIHDVLNSVERIPAKNIYVIPLYDLIPESFKLDRRLSVRIERSREQPEFRDGAG